MYFELMNSPTEARSLYQKELDKDPNNPLMLKRMVSCLVCLLACCLWQQAAGCSAPGLLLAAGTCTTCSRLQGGDLLDKGPSSLLMRTRRAVRQAMPCKPCPHAQQCLQRAVQGCGEVALEWLACPKWPALACSLTCTHSLRLPTLAAQVGLKRGQGDLAGAAELLKQYLSTQVGSWERGPCLRCWICAAAWISRSTCELGTIPVCQNSSCCSSWLLQQLAVDGAA